jgi:hypothetical protein
MAVNINIPKPVIDYNDLDNKPNLVTEHSELILDDGTNPHGTTASDVGALPMPTGTTSQYLRGDGSLETFPTIPSIAGLVPETRTVNGKQLNANITLTASDVGAPSGSGSSTGTNTGDETQSSILTKIGAGNWVNYSDDSTIVGWSSFTNKLIYYKYLSADLVLVIVAISGISDSTTTSVSIPFTNNTGLTIGFQANVTNNGALNIGRSSVPISSDVVDIRATPAGQTFTASGTKNVFCQLLIPIFP